MVYLAEVQRSTLEIQLFQRIFVVIEERRTRIAGTNRPPMPLVPSRLRNSRILHALSVLSADFHRHSQPGRAVRRLDAVPVAPIPFRELGIVVQNELVHVPNEIEVPFPWDV